MLSRELPPSAVGPAVNAATGGRQGIQHDSHCAVEGGLLGQLMTGMRGDVLGHIVYVYLVRKEVFTYIISRAKNGRSFHKCGGRLITTLEPMRCSFQPVLSATVGMEMTLLIHCSDSTFNEKGQSEH